MTEISLSHGKDSTTSVSLNTCGATLTSWKVKGEEMIFVSSLAKRDGSKAIRCIYIYTIFTVLILLLYENILY